MKIFIKLTVLLSLFSVMSCSMLVEERSFMDEMDYESEGFIVPGVDFKITPGDSGQAYRNDHDINNRTPASMFTREQRIQHVSLKKELNKRESSLGEREYREYMKRKEYLSTDSEKIYYLKLPRAQRLEYLSAKSLSFSYKENKAFNKGNDFSDYQKTGADMLPSVAKGMDKRDVKDYWGRPERVDVAGDPRYENERWLYNRGGSSQVVYFENGKVNGWKLE